ncbi:uncharacterized protein A1O9_04269 [Exophiala aquamarina CBS 119918]|uniref:Uncharacterized protein n=1 Tax=Exophiala aquamarina CBS 119918 TaxID=1182545 RepID=A0A072PV44_9EURO|nr:uncharacterized protein A1O9_04269 [Exophiala aquamarina CBS 119918]KEF59425.1 hypothetical protein A1O9_04269 [Exophiala aquamarina CBS 119918]
MHVALEPLLACMEGISSLPSKHGLSLSNVPLRLLAIASRMAGAATPTRITGEIQLVPPPFGSSPYTGC